MPRSRPTLLSFLSGLSLLALTLVAGTGHAQQDAGDVTENRYNYRSILSPTNPYSQQGDNSSVDSYVKTYRGGDLELYSSEGKYLGTVYGNEHRGRYEADSVTNPYGRYGSKYSGDSINNPYGRYGSPYSGESVRNPYAAPGAVPKAIDTNPGLSYGERWRHPTQRRESTLPPLPELPKLDLWNDDPDRR